jgi:glycosyltransferase involved in cell wall biosynthesis
MTARPCVQIGLPVYNAAGTAARALESLLGQTTTDIEVLVSDNASTDGTTDVLAAWAARDSRVRVHREPRNIGAYANFGSVLARAEAPFFMWAAADDWWAPTFIECNLQFLLAHPDYVSSISQVQFEGVLEHLRPRMGTYSLDASAQANMRAFLWRPQFNSRFYALHRTPDLRAAWIDEGFWASDWAIVLNLLRRGKFHEIPQVLMKRGARGASSDWLRTISLWQLDRLTQWLPLMRFSQYALSLPEVRRSPSMLAGLAYWNVRGAAQMALGRMRRTGS